MTQQKSVARSQLSEKIAGAAVNEACNIALWKELLRQAVELDFFEQMFQIVRMHGKTLVISNLRKVVLSDYEEPAIQGAVLANRVVLSFARTMSDVRLLSRFWSQEITIPKMVLLANETDEPDDDFSEEPVSKRRHRLLPDLS